MSLKWDVWRFFDVKITSEAWKNLYFYEICAFHEEIRARYSKPLA